MIVSLKKIFIEKCAITYQIIGKDTLEGFMFYIFVSGQGDYLRGNIKSFYTPFMTERILRI
jgi:hypothetical protein